MLKGLDPDKDADSEKIFEILKDRKDTTEFWLLNEGLFLTAALQAIQNGTPGKVAWATACAERCRSMRIYKQHLEEVVWMGHSAGRLLDFLKPWDQHQANDDEVFWQIKMCLGLCKRSTIYLQKAGLVHDLIAKI
jgi:hypothetical protein